MPLLNETGCGGGTSCWILTRCLLIWGVELRNLCRSNIWRNLTKQKRIKVLGWQVSVYSIYIHLMWKARFVFFNPWQNERKISTWQKSRFLWAVKPVLFRIQQNLLLSSAIFSYVVPQSETSFISPWWLSFILIGVLLLILKMSCCLLVLCVHTAFLLSQKWYMKKGIFNLVTCNIVG